MHKFAILTLAGLALAALLYNQRSLALADDAQPQTEADSQAPEGDAVTADAAVAPEIPKLPADPEALAIFKDAQERLFQHSSVRARFREVVSFTTRTFTAGGTYLSGDPLELRLEYTIDLGPLRGTLLQVCDGQVSWTRQEVAPILEEGETADEEDLYSYTSRRDISQIQRAVEDHPDAGSAAMMADLGLGGLPGMLAGIEKVMTFVGHGTREWNDRNYIVLEARWRDELPAEAQQQMPERVRIYLAEDTLFPERFLYMARRSAESENFFNLFELQFQDVEFDVPISPEAFTFVSPPGTEEHDETRMFLMILEQRQAEAEGRAFEPESGEPPAQ